MLKIKSLYAILGRLSKREKLIFYYAVFFVVLILIDRLLIGTISHKIRTLNKDIKEKESEIKKSLHILAHKDRILKESEKYNSFLNSLKSEEELTAILKKIESIANETAIYLVDVKPAGLKDVGSSEKYLINLKCEAQMEQLAFFMYSIESSDKLLTVEKYQINPKSGASSVAECSMTISKMIMP